jgi:hypothetical protein
LETLDQCAARRARNLEPLARTIADDAWRAPSQQPEREQTMTEKNAYIEKTKAQLDQWNAEIEKLKARAEEAQADAKIHYREEVAKLQERRDHAREHLAKLQAAGDEAWDDVKDGFEKAWHSLSESLHKARERFK